MAGSVSELRAKFSATVSGFKQGIGEVRNNLSGISDESKKVTAEASKSFDKLDQEIKKIGDGVNLDNVENEIKGTTKAVDDMAKTTQQKTAEAQKAWGGLQTTVLKVGTAVAGIGTVIGGAIGGAIMISEDYQKALNGVQAQTGATDEATKGMGESMKNIYANNYGADFADIGESMALVENNTGLAGKELEKMTQNALMLRDTFQYDVAESTKVADTMMKQFGISGDEAFTLIAQGNQKGLDKAGDMMDSFNEYSVYFKQLGFDAEGMFNVFNAGMEGGAFNADKVGDAIKELGIRVKDGSKGTTDAFKSLGLNADQTAQAFAKGGESSQKALGSIFAGLAKIEDPVKRNAIGVSLFGTQFEDLEYKTISAMGKVQNEANKSADTLKKIDQVKYNTVSEALAGMGRTMAVEVIDPIQTKIMPSINDFINKVKTNLPAIREAFATAFTAIINTVNKFKPTFESLFTIFKNVGGWLASTLVVAFSALGSILAPIVNTVTSLVAKFTEWGAFEPILNGLIAGILAYKTYMLALQVPMLLQIARTKALMIATRLLNLTMAMNPIGLIIALLVGLGVALYTAWKKSETFRNIVTGAWNAIKAGAGAVLDWLKVAIPAGIQAISNAWSGFLNWITNLWNGIKSGAVSIWTSIKTAILNLWTSIKTGISNTLSAISSFISKIWNGIKTTTQSILNGAKTIILNIFNAIKTGITNYINNVKQIIKAGFESAKATIQGILRIIGTIVNTGMSAIKTIISGIIRLIKAIFTGDFGAVKGIVTGIINNLKSIFSNGFSNVMSLVKGTVSKILSAFKGIDLVSAGKDIVKGLWNGISNMSGWIKGKVTAFAKGIKDKVTGFFDIHSPSRVFRTIGGQLGEGLAIGIDKSKKMVLKTTEGLAQSAMINPDTVGIGSVTGETLTDQVPDDGGGSGGGGAGGVTTNYQAPLMHVENYYDNGETDKREIANGLYRLQVDHDRARGKKT